MFKIHYAWLLALTPSVPLFCVYSAFLKVLAAKKVEMRMLLERGETLTTYLAAYGRRRVNLELDVEDSESLESAEERTIRRIIQRIFAVHYSSWEYVPALMFCIAVITNVAVLALILAKFDLGLPEDLTDKILGSPYAKNVVAGGLGALIWTIYEVSERYRSGGLTPDTFFSVGSRILIVSSVGAVVGTISVGNATLSWPVCFAIGVIPIKNVQDFLAQQASSKLNIKNSDKTFDHPSLSLLQGWTDETAEKLERVGITSAEQIACMDPFQTLVRSNLEWRTILDLCDQALLLIYVGDKIEKLRPLGIRTAVDLAVIGWNTNWTGYHFGISHDDAFATIADALGMKVNEAKLLVRSVSDDVTVEFLSALWAENTPGDKGK